MVNFRKRKGTTGIGMLIVFIAVIVVSAVAAAVLIGAGGSLEQRSLTTMKGTEAEVASGLSVYSIIGSDASINGTVNNLEMLVRLRPGSDPIALNSTVVTIDSRTNFQTLVYSDSGGPGTYTVYYLRRGGSPLSGYINTGDSAVLNVSLSSDIGTDQNIVIQIIPAQGGIRRVGFMTPNAMVDKSVFLFP